jgi:hypothetical protein
MTPRKYSALLVALVVLVVLLGACSKDNDDASPARTTTTTTTAPSGPPTLAWTVGDIATHGTAAPGDDVIAAVKTTLDNYLAQAVVAPLYTGQPVVDLSMVLSPAALERFNADPSARATLADEGMPPATEAITAERANVQLASVAGPDGIPAVIAARLDLLVHAVGPGLDVDINRYGDVTLVSEEGGWRIDSFKLRADRNSR